MADGPDIDKLATDEMRRLGMKPSALTGRGSDSEKRIARYEEEFKGNPVRSTGVPAVVDEPPLIPQKTSQERAAKRAEGREAQRVNALDNKYRMQRPYSVELTLSKAHRDVLDDYEYVMDRSLGFERAAHVLNDPRNYAPKEGGAVDPTKRDVASQMLHELAHGVVVAHGQPEAIYPQRIFDAMVDVIATDFGNLIEAGGFVWSQDHGVAFKMFLSDWLKGCTAHSGRMHRAIRVEPKDDVIAAFVGRTRAPAIDTRTEDRREAKRAIDKGEPPPKERQPDRLDIERDAAPRSVPGGTRNTRRTKANRGE